MSLSLGLSDISSCLDLGSIFFQEHTEVMLQLCQYILSVDMYVCPKIGGSPILLHFPL